MVKGKPFSLIPDAAKQPPFHAVRAVCRGVVAFLAFACCAAPCLAVTGDNGGKNPSLQSSSSDPVVNGQARQAAAAPGLSAAPGANPSGTAQASPSGGKQKTAFPQTSSPKSANSPAGRMASAKEPVRGFSKNPFSLSHKAMPVQERDKKRPRVSYGPQGRTAQPATLGEDGKVTVSGVAPKKTDDRLTPRRSTFSGGKHTLPNMDKTPTPEVSMRYTLDEKTSTRVTVNPQNEESPLHRPAEPEGTLNSAGVYMDIEVKPDIKLEVGGEYCDIRDDFNSEDMAGGASVGLRWSF